MMTSIFKYLVTGHPLRAFRQIYYFFVLRYPKVPLNLHIGCGQRRISGFINIDRNYSPATDFIANAKRLPCRDGTVDRIETYHVIEHIPQPIIKEVIFDWRRMLKVGGCLVIECPNFDEVVKQYISGDRDMLYSIFGRHRFPGDEHCWGYSPESLKALLESLGFSGTLKPATDYHKDLEPCIRIECIKIDDDGI